MEEDAPKVRVKGGRQRKSSEPAKEKVKFSGYFITVSTNQRYKDESDPNRDNDEIVLEQITADMLQNIGNHIKFTDSSHGWRKDLIEEVAAEFSTEFGNSTSALHVHIFLSIRHRSHISLDYKSVKEHYQKSLGLKNLYFSAKLIRGTQEHFLKRYIEKAQ